MELERAWLPVCAERGEQFDALLAEPRQQVLGQIAGIAEQLAKEPVGQLRHRMASGHRAGGEAPGEDVSLAVALHLECDP